jgi:hypothetical protein
MRRGRRAAAAMASKTARVSMDYLQKKKPGNITPL